MISRTDKINYLVNTIYSNEMMSTLANYANMDVNKFTKLVKQIFLEVCAERFTSSEVDALYSYYTNPAALSVMKKMPDMMKDCFQCATGLMENNE